ncbi:hypothetical protein [Brevibacillus brevis]|nr:hypothetical protein [Brevibacillus brevis]
MQQIIHAVVVDQATTVLLFSMISSQVSFTLERVAEGSHTDGWIG